MVEGIGCLDQRLRRHTADARAGRAVGSVVDEHKVLRMPSDLAQRGEACAAGSDDGDVNVVIHCSCLPIAILISFWSHHYRR